LIFDDLLKHLEFCNFGCYIGHRCVNSFMYADDIVLVSISIVDMQQLVKDCINYLTDKFDLPVNFRKCNFLRVGPRLQYVFTYLI